MLLEGKTAVVYGAAGALGGAVSRTFAREGATVSLAGRNAAALAAVVTEIEAGGGVAEAAVLDATDQTAVERHVQEVVDRTGRIDVSINLIGVDHVQGPELVEMSPAAVSGGLEPRIQTQFLTVRAAARHMIAQGSGAILMVTATPDRLAIPGAGAFAVACGAVEALSRALAVELGPKGVRVACIRSAGSPDAAGVHEAHRVHADRAGESVEQFETTRQRRTLLRRLPRVTEVADVAAFLASDRASAMTATIANVTCGELLD
jgi:3-oxoacyl-[acyl-carrier protein] reductase